MTITNYVFIIVGAIVTLLGLLSIIFPNLTKIINAPGGSRIKSIIATIIGLIFLIIGLTIELPTN
jgi:hypothetical protein